MKIATLTLLLILKANLLFSQLPTYFVKFQSNVEQSEIENLIIKNKKLNSNNFYCPFHTNSKTLQKTYIAKNIPYDILKEIESEFVEYIELEPKYKFFYTPNDLSNNQWNLNQISASLAWNETTGNNVLIAIVDDAVELSHSDLSGNIYVNTGEVPANGIDDDGNGYIDDVNGWDAANNDNNPNPPSNATPSYFSHGTHVAGISAAVTNNSNGISSIGFNSTILPVKIGLDANASLTGAYAGLDYAIAARAQIISMSWGGGGYSITYQNIFNYANSLGIVCIAAAGNNNSSTAMYPAAYNNVISVGATDQSDQKASFSNYGTTIDVMAPGVSIYSTLVQNGYGFKSGTSMACPLVSGLAALMLAKDPSITPTDLENCLKTTCDNIDSQNTNYIGFIGAGRVNAYEALRCLKPITASFTSNLSFSCINSLIQFTDLSNNSPTSWLWSFPGGIPSSSTLQNPSVSYGSSGIYNVELIATNANGTDTLNMSNFVQIGMPSAQLSGNTTLFSGYSTLLSVNFTGTSPWSITYFDGTTSTNLNGITSNPFQFSVSPNSTTTYSISSMNDASCMGNVLGSAVVTIISSNNSSNCGASLTSLFQKTFTSPGVDVARSMVSTQDGGAIILAKTNSFSQGNFDYLVIKLDSNYNIEWQKTFGSSTEEAKRKSKIIQDNDGNYVIASHVNYSTAWFPQLIKLDANGNILWTKTINSSSGKLDHFRDVIQTSDGSYLCTGTTNAVIASADLFLTKFDTNGSLIWSKVFGRPGNDHGLKTIELSNGDFVSCGMVQALNSDRESFLVKFDAHFNIIWNKSFSFTNQIDVFEHLIEKPNGNLLAFGSSTGFNGNRNLIALEVDSNGNIIWSKHYGNQFEERGAGILGLPDGTTLITGYSESSLGVKNTILFKIDGVGNIIWAKKYANYSTRSALSDHELLDTTSSGEILFCGNIVETGSDEDILLIKADKCGFIDCGESDLILPATSISPTSANLLFSNVTYGTITPFDVFNQIAALTDTIACQSVNVPITCNITANFNYQLNCTGQSTQFVDVSTDSIGNIIYWEWYFGDGDSIIGNQSPSHNYAIAGNYNVMLIVGSDSLTCFDTITTSINIPNSLTVILVDTSICTNDSVQLNPVIICEASPYNVSWTPITGLSNPNVLNPFASPSITTTYTITITDFNSNTTSSSVTVNVSSGCCVSYPIFNIPSEICLGSSFTPVNSSLSSGTTLYSWDFGQSATPSSYVGQTPVSINFSAPGTYPITLVMNDDCGSDSVVHYIGVNTLPIVNIINDTLLCVSDTLYLGDSTIGNLLYTWTPSLTVSDSLSSNPYIVDSINSQYFLTIMDPFTNCRNTDSVFITFFNTQLNIGPDTTNCNNDSIVIGSDVFHPNYLWNTGDTTDTIVVSNSGVYWLTAYQQYCSITDSINVSINQINADLGNDTVLCNVNSYSLSPNVNNASFTWQDGSNDSIYLATTSGSYYVIIQQSICTASDTIDLTFNQISLSLGNDTILCEIDSLQIIPIPNNGSFTWSNGSTNTSYIVTSTGEYWTTMTFQNCFVTDSIYVEFAATPTSLVADTIICSNELILIDASTGGNANYLWSPIGDTTASVLLEAGIYTLITTNNCGVANSNFEIKEKECNCNFNIPNVFSPNYDGENEYFSLINMGKFCELQSVEIFNRWGEKLFFSNSIYYSWDGRTSTGEEAPEGTYYYIIEVNGNFYNGNFSLFR